MDPFLPLSSLFISFVALQAQRCPTCRITLPYENLSSYAPNFAVIDILQGLKAAGVSPETDAAACSRPPLGLGASDILPALHDVPESIWKRVEARYRLPEAALVGSPRQWQRVGVTSTGHPAYRGTNLYLTSHRFCSCVSVPNVEVNSMW